MVPRRALLRAADADRRLVLEGRPGTRWCARCCAAPGPTGRRGRTRDRRCWWRCRTNELLTPSPSSSIPAGSAAGRTPRWASVRVLVLVRVWPPLCRRWRSGRSRCAPCRWSRRRVPRPAAAWTCTVHRRHRAAVLVVQRDPVAALVVDRRVQVGVQVPQLLQQLLRGSGCRSAGRVPAPRSVSTISSNSRGMFVRPEAKKNGGSFVVPDRRRRSR